MTEAPEDPGWRPAAELPGDRLLELLADLRDHLRERGEAPGGDWVEATHDALRAHHLDGVAIDAPLARALAFVSVTSDRAYGHVHVEAAAAPVEIGVSAVGMLRRRLPPAVRLLDVGFSGFSAGAEDALAERLHSEGPLGAVYRRLRLTKSLSAADEARPDRFPALVHLPVREVPLPALAELDLRAFARTIDAELVGTDRSHHERVLRELHDGLFGRFLDEASTAIVETPEGRLVGAILTAERTPRTALLLDLAVDPERQGRGYGRYLLRWALRALRALAYDEAELWVTAANGRARRLYETAGFGETQRTLLYRWRRQPQRGS